MNIPGAISSTNSIYTNVLAAANSTQQLLVKSLTGAYIIKTSVPIAQRPSSGQVYPRYV